MQISVKHTAYILFARYADRQRYR